MRTQDPRDKIYAVANIAYAVFPETESLRHTMSARDKANEVFKSVSRLLVSHIPAITLLSFVENRAKTKVPCLPSWSPDYSVTSTHHRLIIVGVLFAHNPSNSREALNVCAFKVALRCFADSVKRR